MVFACHRYLSKASFALSKIYLMATSEQGGEKSFPRREKLQFLSSRVGQGDVNTR